MVIYLWGMYVRNCNIADLPEVNPISVENISVDFCEKGNGNMINDRKVLMEASEGSVIKKQVDVE